MNGNGERTSAEKGESRHGRTKERPSETVARDSELRIAVERKVHAELDPKIAQARAERDVAIERASTPESTVRERVEARQIESLGKLRDENRELRAQADESEARLRSAESELAEAQADLRAATDEHQAAEAALEAARSAKLAEMDREVAQARSDADARIAEERGRVTSEIARIREELASEERAAVAAGWRAAWDEPPRHLKERFSDRPNLEERTDTAIAALLVREVAPEAIADGLDVPISRVESVAGGGGVPGSRLSQVRSAMVAARADAHPPELRA